MAIDAHQSQVRQGRKLVSLNFTALAAGLFPVLANLRAYNARMFLADLRAALNGAAVSLPQGMAYAIIAGLPIQMGLFATALAPLVGGLLAHSRLTMIGPTNATAVMVSTGLVALGSGYNKDQVMPLFGCMIGVFLVLGGIMRVASLSQFISRTVIIGYISVASLWIIGKQIGPAAGAEVERANSFFGQLGNTIVALQDTNLWAVSAALLTFATWYILRRRFPHVPAIAVSIIFSSVVVAAYNALREVFTLPDLGLNYLSPVSLSEWRLTPPVIDSALVSDLALPALAVAFLAALENTSMSKSIAAKKNQTVDLNRDMVALGVANLACAFGRAMPASGSLTRTALNVASGAVTQMSSILCGVLCLIGAALFGPLIGFIPEPVLATMVVCIAITLVDVPRIKCALNTTRSDMVVLLTTFVAGLIVRLDIAIFIGVATSIALFLRKVGAPQLVEYAFDEQGQLREMDEKEGREHPSISIIHVEGDLFFGAADLFRDHIRRIAADTSLKVIILRMRNARHLDATTVMALQELINFLRETGRHLIISGAMKDVYRVLKNSGTLELIGRENVFIGSSRNPNLATRNALKRARDIMGGTANVRIYYDPAKKNTQS
jgi:SulP family sulfate permease